MNRCEDFPCCGHGPPPLGDGGGCPDEEGRFDCVLCSVKLERNVSSSICYKCQRNPRIMYPDDPEMWEFEDIPEEGYDEGEEPKDQEEERRPD